MAFTGGPLGGNFWYFMPAASFTWYVPATRSSNFAFNVSGAFIRPYGDKEIPIFLRERLGGDRSIRGYKFGAIVPVTYRDGKYHAYFDAQGGALLGGNKMYYFNIEYVYALAGPLKTALFFDAGNTWIEYQAFTPLKLQACYGVEARIFLPIFQAPLRFIYAINLEPDHDLRPARAPHPERYAGEDELRVHHRQHVLRRTCGKLRRSAGRTGAATAREHFN